MWFHLNGMFVGCMARQSPQSLSLGSALCVQAQALCVDSVRVMMTMTWHHRLMLPGALGIASIGCA